MRERDFIRLLHLVLSVPILGYLYGPVAAIPGAAWFTRWIAVPLVVLSGLWLWLKPRVAKRLAKRFAKARVLGKLSRQSM
jgi:hypothetical protein